jgi:ribosome-associated heat shock protein Hsp15
MYMVRLDKWLWAARFFKTRAQAKSEIEGGHVHLNGARGKASKDLRLGDTLEIRHGLNKITINVTSLTERRGNAKTAASLFKETESSIHEREIGVARRKMERAGLKVPSTRPTKKDRRALRELKETNEPTG